MPKRVMQGVVVSDKADKTLRVDIARRFRHRKYGKIVQSKTVCYVHDEHNEAKQGDRVEIVESRPHSRKKRWELVQVVERVADLGASS